MAENGHIPNSYQTPNIVVDQLMQYLLPEEVVVLTYAIRHILGWRERLADRRAFISLAMFENGFTTKEGAVYGGCGLSRPKIAAALKSLCEHGIMAKIGGATQEGQEWALRLDEPAIDWESLKARSAARAARNQKRVTKAASASASKRRVSEEQYDSRTGSTATVPPVRQPYPQYDSRTAGSTATVPEVVRQSYPNKHIQTHDQTHIATAPKDGAVARAPADLPEPTAQEPASEPRADPTAHESETPARPVQPHIALIDAYLEALDSVGRRPIEADPYKRRVRIARAMERAGVTGAQIAAFIQAVYDPEASDQFWQEKPKPIPLEMVAEQLPGWLATRRPAARAATASGEPEYHEPAMSPSEVEDYYSIEALMRRAEAKKAQMLAQQREGSALP